MNPADVTFVILTKNEERNIADCLRSLPVGARALVYDAESADRTRTIAADMGARIAVAPWRGVGAARAAAEQLVQTPWLFILDADERMSPELAAEIPEQSDSPTVDAYTVPRANYFCDRWIRGAAWWPDRQVRLYRKGRARQASENDRRRAAGHVYYEAPGRTADLAGHVVHYSYATVADYRRKFKRYTDDEASAHASNIGAFVSAWLVVPLRAAWLLVGRRGALDGWRGVFVSVASALYPAVVETKALRTRR